MVPVIDPFLVIYGGTPRVVVRSVIDQFASGDAIYIPPTPIQRDGTIQYVNPNAGVVLR